jgi:hypothetical protein
MVVTPKTFEPSIVVRPKFLWFDMFLDPSCLGLTTHVRPNKQQTN